MNGSLLACYWRVAKVSGLYPKVLLLFQGHENVTEQLLRTNGMIAVSAI